MTSPKMPKTCNEWWFFGVVVVVGEWVGVGWVRASCGNKIPQHTREAIQAHWLALGGGR